jgi:hypothetical protein
VLVGQILVVARAPDAFYKDPDEIRDCPVDWTDDLPPGVTIVGSVFLPDDPALNVDSDSFDDTGTVARFSGGTVHSRTWVTNRVTLADGQLYDYRFMVVCRN